MDIKALRPVYCDSIIFEYLLIINKPFFNKLKHSRNISSLYILILRDDLSPLFSLKVMQFKLWYAASYFLAYDS